MSPPHLPVWGYGVETTVGQQVCVKKTLPQKMAEVTDAAGIIKLFKAFEADGKIPTDDGTLQWISKQPQTRARLVNRLGSDNRDRYYASVLDGQLIDFARNCRLAIDVLRYDGDDTIVYFIRTTRLDTLRQLEGMSTEFFQVSLGTVPMALPALSPRDELGETSSPIIIAVDAPEARIKDDAFSCYATTIKDPRAGSGFGADTKVIVLRAYAAAVFDKNTDFRIPMSADLGDPMTLLDALPDLKRAYEQQFSVYNGKVKCTLFDEEQFSLKDLDGRTKKHAIYFEHVFEDNDILTEIVECRVLGRTENAALTHELPFVVVDWFKDWLRRGGKPPQWPTELLPEAVCEVLYLLYRVASVYDPTVQARSSRVPLRSINTYLEARGKFVRYYCSPNGNEGRVFGNELLGKKLLDQPKRLFRKAAKQLLTAAVGCCPVTVLPQAQPIGLVRARDVSPSCDPLEELPKNVEELFKKYGKTRDFLADPNLRDNLSRVTLLTKVTDFLVANPSVPLHEKVQEALVQSIKRGERLDTGIWSKIVAAQTGKASAAPASIGSAELVLNETDFERNYEAFEAVKEKRDRKLQERLTESNNEPLSIFKDVGRYLEFPTPLFRLPSYAKDYLKQQKHNADQEVAEACDDTCRETARHRSETLRVVLEFSEVSHPQSLWDGTKAIRDYSSTLTQLLIETIITRYRRARATNSIFSFARRVFSPHEKAAIVSHLWGMLAKRIDAKDKRNAAQQHLFRGLVDYDYADFLPTFELYSYGFASSQGKQFDPLIYVGTFEEVLRVRNFSLRSLTLGAEVQLKINFHGLRTLSFDEMDRFEIGSVREVDHVVEGSTRVPICMTSLIGGYALFRHEPDGRLFGRTFEIEVVDVPRTADELPQQLPSQVRKHLAKKLMKFAHADVFDCARPTNRQGAITKNTKSVRGSCTCEEHDEESEEESEEESDEDTIEEQAVASDQYLKIISDLVSQRAPVREAIDVMACAQCDNLRARNKKQATTESIENPLTNERTTKQRIRDACIRSRFSGDEEEVWSDETPE